MTSCNDIRYRRINCPKCVTSCNEIRYRRINCPKCVTSCNDIRYRRINCPKCVTLSDQHCVKLTSALELLLLLPFVYFVYSSFSLFVLFIPLLYSTQKCIIITQYFSDMKPLFIPPIYFCPENVVRILRLLHIFKCTSDSILSSEVMGCTVLAEIAH